MLFGLGLSDFALEATVFFSQSFVLPFLLKDFLILDCAEIFKLVEVLIQNLDILFQYLKRVLIFLGLVFQGFFVFDVVH